MSQYDLIQAICYAVSRASPHQLDVIEREIDEAHNSGKYAHDVTGVASYTAVKAAVKERREKLASAPRAGHPVRPSSPNKLG